MIESYLLYINCTLTVVLLYWFSTVSVQSVYRQCTDNMAQIRTGL